MHRILLTATACLALAVVVAVFPVHQVRADGHESPVRPYLGVSLSDLGDRQRDRLDLDPRVEGALVTEVREDSPADRAGLRENDVIIEVEGVTVADTDAAIAAIRSLGPDERITLTVNRRGLERTLTATLGAWPESRNRWTGRRGGNTWSGDESEAPNVFRFHGNSPRGLVITDDGREIVIGDGEDLRIERKDGNVFVYRGDEDDPEVIDLDGDDRVVIVDEHHRRGGNDRVDRDRRHGRHAAPRALRSGGDASGGFLGVQSEALTNGLREYFGVDEDHGVLVSEVVEGSPAAEAGLRPGDVILEVDGKAIAGPADLRSTVRAVEPGREASLRIVRDRSARNLSVRVARAGDFSDAAPHGDHRFPGLHDGHGIRLHDLGVDLGSLHEELDALRHELHRELPGLHEEIRQGLEGLDLRELKEELHRELPRIHEELRRGLRELDDEEMRELHEELRRGLEEMRQGLRESGERLRETGREPGFTRDAA